MKNTLIILRSVSGGGKSTFASLIEELALGANFRCVIATADDYFIDRTGEYKFDATKLGRAHEACREKVDISMGFKVPIIFCANTNTTDKEIVPYIDLAKKYNYQVISLVVENRHGNKSSHDVPISTLEKQEQRLKGSLKLI